jgi:E3 ubiquitin-protein ligase EDD1
VFDVIPSTALEGLTAEDLRLLLNGVGDINVQTLISYTSFNDESGK